MFTGRRLLALVSLILLVLAGIGIDNQALVISMTVIGSVIAIPAVVGPLRTVVYVKRRWLS